MKKLRKKGFFFVSVAVMIPITILMLMMKAGGENNMEGTKTMQRAVIPPIDRMIPSKLETATFALG